MRGPTVCASTLQKTQPPLFQPLLECAPQRLPPPPSTFFTQRPAPDSTCRLVGGLHAFVPPSHPCPFPATGPWLLLAGHTGAQRSVGAAFKKRNACTNVCRHGRRGGMHWGPQRRCTGRPVHARGRGEAGGGGQPAEQSSGQLRDGGCGREVRIDSGHSGCKADLIGYGEQARQRLEHERGARKRQKCGGEAGWQGAARRPQGRLGAPHALSRRRASAAVHHARNSAVSATAHLTQGTAPSAPGRRC